MLDKALQRAWYNGAVWVYLLLPLALLFWLLSSLRKALYWSGLKAVWRAPVPVIVVGNISVGGTGKTPLTIALVQALQQAGLRPGVVSRGYGSQANHFPLQVTAAMPAAITGDEPLLIARRSQCPVVIAPDRTAAAKFLLAHHACDVIISDDGLQHYALARDMEIILVDGQRGLGNRMCLPAGPLRETAGRLQSADAVFVNSPSNREILQQFPCSAQIMQISASALINLHSGERIVIGDWTGPRNVAALAGIGNPQRFATTLTALGFSFTPHWFADHHVFRAEDLASINDEIVITTEKDAVKLGELADHRFWYLQVEAELPTAWLEQTVKHIQGLVRPS